MSVSAINRRQYEDRESGTSVPTLVLCALVLFTLAILLMYICVATPVDGTSMGAIRNVMCGLGGSLRFALPLILAWAGVLCVGAARGKGVSPVRVTLDALLILCLFTAVQLFFVERIKHDYMTLSTFSNFVTKSYGFGKGGGAIGALLACDQAKTVERCHYRQKPENFVCALEIISDITENILYHYHFYICLFYFINIIKKRMKK